MSKKFFILAGEASGDLHGAKLIEAFKAIDADTRFVGMGGPRMAAAGLNVAKDLDGMQVVGFWEVAKHYGFFKTVFYQLLDRLKQEKPDALICIDYPGFNLRFAREVKALGIPCLYYIVPQVWAWKPKRAAKMAAFVDRAYCVFEFEPPFFDKFKSPERKMKTVFVGHPILDRPFDIAPCGVDLPEGPRTVGFLPGSRANECAHHLGPMSEGFRRVYEKDKSLRALLSAPPAMRREDEARAREVMRGAASSGGAVAFQSGAAAHIACVPGPKGDDAEFAVEGSHASIIPALSDFSVVKSGTSTLEAGLRGNPLCVVYRGGAISFAIARMLVDIPVFSLVNIVLGRYAVPELLQGEVNPGRIAAEIERGLNDRKYIEAQRAALAELPGKLGGAGASTRAAQGMLDFLGGRE